MYDVTNSGSEGTNRAVCVINSVGHAVGLGGVFHGAVEVHGHEWSFGFCAKGTGVYSCPARGNPFYTYRETISLGNTAKSRAEVRALLARLKKEWPGNSYNLLNRNCCHFCEVFSKELGTRSVPGWLNRLASGAENAIYITDKVVDSVLSWSQQVSQGSQCALSWLRSSICNWNIPVVSSDEGFLANGIRVQEQDEIQMQDPRYVQPIITRDG